MPIPVYVPLLRDATVPLSIWQRPRLLCLLNGLHVFVSLAFESWVKGGQWNAATATSDRLRPFS